MSLFLQLPCLLSQSLFLMFARFAILNNACVLYVGVCVGVPQAFVRILGGCVLI